MATRGTLFPTIRRAAGVPLGRGRARGVCDDHQFLCFALALWNGKDPILKERLFGLTNSEGNHGEDVKELYWYLDGTPTHSYMQMLYKYPQSAFPYDALVHHGRGRGEPELELLDTGVFDEDRYFDVFVEYAKGAPDDILMLVTVHNRGPEDAPLHVLPTLWFRRIADESPAIATASRRTRSSARSASRPTRRCCTATTPTVPRPRSTTTLSMRRHSTGTRARSARRITS